MRAVIFDFDGTLVDTMPLHFEAYRTTFAEAGLDLSEEDFYRSIGGKASETIPKLLRGRPCSRTNGELHARKKAIVEDLLRTRPIPTLSTAELLPFLFGVVPMAIASSGSRAGIEIVLDRLAWRPYLAAIVTGEDAPRGKPAPDLFTIAAERLGASPGDCLVFEDTDDGIAAAKAAGMRAIDVRRAAAR
jgi:beta-phosphoglucomutase-like phosphatase (HAD superfamily)